MSDDIQITWTDNADNEDGYRIYRSRDGGSTWTQASGDLPPDTTQWTDTGLLDGEQYVHKVEAYTEDATSESGTTSPVTTDLPDASGLALDASVEDQFGATWNDTIDYGSYRLEYKKTSASTWTAGGTEPESVTSHTIAGLADGEKYDVRLRTETEHVTGDWLIITETTFIPTPSDFVVDATRPTGVDVSWTDTNDDENGWKLFARRHYTNEVGPWQTLGEWPANTESGSTDDLVPGQTYDVYVRVYTEHVYADSQTIQVTADSQGLPTTRAGTSGWHVEVDHPSGAMRTPTVIDDPQRDQQLNGKPSIRIPVPRNEYWTDAEYEDAPMRVWKDGVRQPIEALERVEHTPEQTVLVGTGGLQLERKIVTEIDSKPVDDVVRNIVSSTTDYQVNVDDPTAATTADQLQQSTSLSGWDDLIQTEYIQDTDPVAVSPSAIDLLQTCHLGYDGSYVGTDGGFEGTYTRLEQGTTQPWYIANRAAELQDGGRVQFYVQPEYDVPAERVAFAAHIVSGSGSGTAPVSVNFIDSDGTRIQLATYPSTGWVQYESPGVGMLEAGTQYGIEVVGASGFTYVVDALCQYDTAYTPTTFGTPAQYDTIDGPALYPETYQLQTIDSTPPISVTGGRFDGSFSSTAGAQQIELSNDQGASWPLSASNRETLEGDFSSLGPAIRARITLSNYGSGRAAPPAKGYLGQSITGYSLYADLDETPLAIDQAHETRLLDVLRYYARYSDSLFEIRWDEQAGALSFEWAQPGQRGVATAEGASDYDVAKTTANRPDQVRVQGSAIPATMQLTASTGTTVSLEHNNLVTSSESVVSQADGTQYTRGVDYTMAYNNGEITILGDGNIADSETIDVSYRWQPAAYSTINPVENPTIRDVTIQGLVTERGCGIAARRIAQQIQEPLWEASVTLPEADTEWSLLDEIDPEAVPTDGPLKVRGVEETPRGTSLTLGSREQLNEIIQDVKTRIEQVSQRT